MNVLTETARQILSAPRQDRLGMIDQHPNPEALKAEIIRLHKRHKGFRVYLHGKPRSVAMIDGAGATLDKAHKMAVWQFGADRVERVISGAEERGEK